MEQVIAVSNFKQNTRHLITRPHPNDEGKGGGGGWCKVLLLLVLVLEEEGRKEYQ